MPYAFNPPHEAQHIKLDLFPAHVTFEDTDLGTAHRVIVTDAHFYILRDGVESPEAYVYGELEAFSGGTIAGYDIALSDGRVYHVVRADGCACGSRLRGFHPFPGVPYARMN